MKRQLTLGLIQMAMEKSKEKNLDKAAHMIAKASKQGAKIISLPELFTTLYFPQERNFKAEKIAEKIPGPTSKALSRLAEKHKIILIGGSIYEKANNKFYNTIVTFDEAGRLIGKYRKIHIPQDPFFYEQDYFEKGNLGYRVINSRCAKIGTMICYDQWYPEAARINALKGAEILVYPTAIGRVKGLKESEGNWQKAWESVQAGHAIANGVIVMSVNRVGKEKRMSFWGGSFVINQFGKFLAKGSDKEEVLIAACDLSLGKKVKEEWGFLRNRRPDTYHKLLKK